MATTVYVDLMMDNGEIGRIECPGKFEDELHDTLSDAHRRGDWWSPGRFDGCKLDYMGISLDRISMKRVVGML